mgnify:CR=1 FL=1
MNFQDAARLTIPEGDVRNIHDTGSRLLWSAVGYDVDYEGDTEQVSYTGKNLLGISDGERTTNGITFTRLNNTITCSGTLTAGTWLIMTEGNFTILDKPFPAGTHTLSISEPTTKNLEMTIRDSNGEIVSLTSGSTTLRAGRTSTTFTTPVEIGRYRLVCPGLTAGEVLDGVAYKNIQLESGSTSTSFEPYVGGQPSPSPNYPQNIDVVTGVQTVTVDDGGSNSQTYTIDLGSIELCKIGDYQDYIYKGSDGWYLHREIRRRTLDGTETWGVSTYQGVRFFYLNTTDGLITSNSQVVVLSDKFLGQWGGANNTIVFSANPGTPRRMMIFTNDLGTTTSEWKTWLGSNNVLTYYALETPTDTKITDSTLVSQLDAVHNRITRYDYQYTISGNLPIIINRTGLT